MRFGEFGGVFLIKAIKTHQFLFFLSTYHLSSFICYLIYDEAEADEAMGCGSEDLTA